MIVISHRGSSKHPENSLSAIRHAFHEGFISIEFDVRHSKDNTYYLLHDASLKSTTNMNGMIKDMHDKELFLCRLGNGEILPTLRQALKHAKHFKHIFIELKSSGCEEFLMEELSLSGMKEKIIVGSFIRESLAKIRSIDKDINLCLECRIITSMDIKYANRIGSEYIAGYIHLMTRHKASKAKTAGLKVLAYTVTSDRLAVKARKLGLDGIFTNILIL